MNGEQLIRAKRSHVSPVSLVKLTQYSNLPTKSVAKVWYFSDKPATYDYGNQSIVRTFLPVIVGGSDFSATMSHLPQPDDPGPLGRSFDLHLSNAAINGIRLVTQLQAFNLEGSSIEIAQLLLTSIQSFPLDLTAFAGDEHTVLFRGRVLRVAPISNDRFTLQCIPELPTVADSWIIALDDADPRDVGVRVPRVYGKAVHVPVVSWQTGFSGTMVDSINSTENNVNKLVSDASGLPSAFVLLIGTEQINCTKVNSTTIKIESGGRGFNTTTAVAHAGGDSFVEYSATETWLISDSPSVAVPNVYSVHESTGKLVRINELTTPLNKDLADISTIPGRTVTSFQRAIKGVTTQLPLTITGAAVEVDEGINAMDRIGTGYGVEATFVGAVSGGEIVATFKNIGAITTQTIRVQVTNGFSSGGNVAVIVNAVMIGTILRSEIPANGADPKEFTFTTTQTTHTVTIDPLTGSGIRVHNIERDVNIFSTELPQVGTSGATNVAGANAANLYDGNLSTAVDFTTTANEYCEVTFPAPGYTYDIQRIRIYAKLSSAKYFEVRVDGVAAKSGKMNLSATTPRWYEFDTDLVGNVIRFHTAAAVDHGIIYEIQRTIYDAASASQTAAGVAYFADVDGIPVPPPDVLTWSEGEDFDDGTWNVSGATVAVDTVDLIEGTGSQKITITEPTPVFQTNTTTNWTGSNATVTAPTDEGHSEGSAAIKAVATSSVSVGSLTFDDDTLAIDLTDTGAGIGIFLFDVKPTWVGAEDDIQIQLGNNFPDRYIFDFPAGAIPRDVWSTVAIDWTDETIRITGGTPVMTNVDYFVIRCSGNPPVTGNAVVVDNIRVYRDRTVVIQNNAIGALNFTGAAAAYRLGIKGIGGKVITNLMPKVYISDDTGTGTTLTTDYRRIDFPMGMVEGSWVQLESEGFEDINTPDVSAVRTLRVELLLQPPAFGAHTRFTSNVVRVDIFEFAGSLQNAWKGVEGQALTHPADIMRHWIEIVGGETIDYAAYDALYTAIGAAAKWGFDARSLGFTWVEILQRMAFEARANVIAVETAAGRVWKMLAADIDYGFGSPAASAIVTQLHGLSDEGRGLDDLGSYFTFRYGFDASLPGDGNEESYGKLLLANPIVSGVPISTTVIAAAAARFGAIDAGPVAFLTIQDDATAEDVAGYYVQERIASTRRVFRLTDVAWFDALPYDLGDLVYITPPWGSSAVVCRITEMAKAFDSQSWRMTAVEVLSVGLHT